MNMSSQIHLNQKYVAHEVDFSVALCALDFFRVYPVTIIYFSLASISTMFLGKSNSLNNYNWIGTLKFFHIFDQSDRSSQDVIVNLIY